MRNILLFLFVLFFTSCTKRIEQKAFTNGDIVIKSYTIERGDIQSSKPNKSYVEIKKGLKTYELLVYDSYGVNNVSVIFKNKIIFIKGDDEQTADLIKSAHLKSTDILGYKILK